MTPKAAKKVDLWYDTAQRHWVLQDPRMTGDAMYLAPQPLRDITPELFVERYALPLVKQ